MSDKTVWIFDVDGVITHPSKKVNTDPKIFDHILEKLEKEEPVILNTGRSLIWITERVTNPILAKIKDKKILDNFQAVGEMGGVWLTFDKRGEIHKSIDNSLSIPKSLIAQIENLIKNKYSSSMFYDKTKQTMISIEMHEGFSLNEYHNAQTNLVKDVKEVIDNSKLDHRFKIDTTTIAADIMGKHVGKAFAVHRILDWLRKKGIEPRKITTFGDSLSDLPMAEKLYELRFKVKFVFVGENNHFDKTKYPFPIHITKSKYEKGTLEYLLNY